MKFYAVICILNFYIGVDCAPCNWSMNDAGHAILGDLLSKAMCTCDSGRRVPQTEMSSSLVKQKFNLQSSRKMSFHFLHNPTIIMLY